MKKSLIALAVLAASGAAMAQSSVTMYGVADLSLAKANGVSAQMSGNGVMNNGNSRLGVRGVEDLGGGLKASFNLFRNYAKFHQLLLLKGEKSPSFEKRG